LVFREGSYGDLLLVADVAPFRVGPAGAGEAIDGDGLGIDVDRSHVEEFVSDAFEVSNS
jgi:hypothetical protein